MKKKPYARGERQNTSTKPYWEHFGDKHWMNGRLGEVVYRILRREYEAMDPKGHRVGFYPSLREAQKALEARHAIKEQIHDAARG